MKTKPDTTQFNLPKDPTAFLEGGEADKADKAPMAQTTTTAPAVKAPPRYGRARVQKIFNFPEELADRLRREALTLSEEQGRRVTEKDIVVEALEAFFNQK